MDLAITAEHTAIGIEHRRGVEIGLARALEKTDRQYHLQLARELAKMIDRRIVRERRRQREMLRTLIDAEIRCLEQFLQQDDLRALRRRLSHQFFAASD